MAKISNERYSQFFLLTAIFSIVFLITLIIALNSYLTEAFSSLGHDSDAIYWVIGTVAVISIFGLLTAYMVYSKKNENFTTRSKILALILLPLLIFGSIFGIIMAIGSYAPENRGPFLSWMDDPKTTMTISFETKEKDDFKIKYGISKDSLEDSGDFTRSDQREYDDYYHYKITLTDLDSDQVYYYNIPNFMDNIAQFKTAPDNNKTSYKFILYGDSREDNRFIDNQHYALMNQMKNTHDMRDIAFIINTGDTARVHNDPTLWNMHFDAIKEISHSVPYFVASGNHEWNTDDPLELGKQPALDIQDFPEKDDPADSIYSLDEVSFSFGYSNSFFIFLGYPHTGSNNTEYMTWLENQLDIGNSSYDFTFVSFHRPPFDDREGDDSDDNPDIIKLECPLFHNYCIEAVFNGHNHVLAHQKIKWSEDPFERDVHYIISGGGGASLREPQYGEWNNDYDMGFSGETVFCKKAYNYYLIEVDAEKAEAKFTAYELGGTELESFTIGAYT